MRVTVRLLVGAVLVGTLIPPPAPARADEVGTELSEHQVRVFIPGASSSLSRGGPRIRVVDNPVVGPLDGFGCPNIANPMGRSVYQGGVLVYGTCIETPPPPDPTVGVLVVRVRDAVRDQVGLSLPVDVRPAKGLTGLPSALVYAGTTTTRPVTADNGATRVVGLADLTALCWFDGQTRLGCVSGTAAVGEHRFVLRTRGIHELRIEATWHVAFAIIYGNATDPSEFRTVPDDVLTATIAYPMASAEAVIN
ncbi:MAG: hypothetical protein AB7L13_00550 [Acidimicrobiia bacterium]